METERKSSIYTTSLIIAVRWILQVKIGSLWKRQVQIANQYSPTETTKNISGQYKSVSMIFHQSDLNYCCSRNIFEEHLGAIFQDQVEK